MDESKKSPMSPLIRGKPAWHVRRERFHALLLLVNGPLIFFFVFFADSDDLWNLPEWLSGLAMLGWLAVMLYIMSLYMNRYGLSVWQMNKTLLGTIDGVPCPNCLYPLCELDEADAVFVCPECGCGIRGADAIRAWESLRGYVIPKSWGQAWERRLDGIGE